MAWGKQLSLESGKGTGIANFVNVRITNKS